MQSVRLLLAAALWLLVPLNPLQAADAPAAEEVQVELLEAGSAPRHELRFAPPVGTKQTAVMMIKIEMATSVNGQAPPAPTLPAQKFTMELAVRDVSPEGDIAYDFKYLDVSLVEDPNVQPAIADAIRGTLKPLAGATGKGVITNRGLTKSAEFNLPPDLNPTIKATLDGMKDSLNRLSSPVPAEAVGVGGKWKVTQKIVANGMALTQVSTHTLKQVDAEGFVMDLAIEQTAEAQEIKAPGLPPGAKLTLTSLATTGGGQSKIKVGTLFPEKSEVQIESKAKMMVDLGALKQNIDTTTKMQMTVE